MATLQPREPYTADELAKLYPESLELQQVQILLRHGERTPVSSRFQNAGLPPFWPYCTATKAFKSVILESNGTLDELGWTRHLERMNDHDAPVLSASVMGEVDAICTPGELTDRGRDTTRALGSRLRNLYVNQLGFLPSALDASSVQNIKLRSTPIVRALESVQHTFIGLYPKPTHANDIPLPVIVTRIQPEETLYPNEGACTRFRELAHAFADRTAKLYNSGPELAYINQKIGKWMPKDSPEVKVDSHPRLSGVMDTINASIAHDKQTRLPKEFYDAQVRSNIDKICVEEWFVGYAESNEYRRLGIGAAIGDLTQRMVQHARGDYHRVNNTEAADFKMSLSGCHDTTIAATLAALGAFDPHSDKWPNFTSNIAFELFKDKNIDARQTSTVSGATWPSREKTWWYSLFSISQPSVSNNDFARTPLVELNDNDKAKLDGYYVRLRYNDKPLTIPFCRGPGKHLDGNESFCTLAAFKQATDSFTPRSWKNECKANLGQPAMKIDIERPPGL